eukprot:CAMPEP_0184376530 /NCGR_PEP_ID=MMETSP0007-20130409/1524_1 /TAXON_ID=97485 /ORGANISM="Prymnesium parvum, Strain Texoma1" /LENGTH=129 /DNA_ID=CAMNT_0026720105 /DNA_START=226 /DNA_END=615 /DNA_ORIENTATION=-
MARKALCKEQRTPYSKKRLTLLRQSFIMCCSGPIHIIQGRQPGNRPPGLRADTPLPAQEEGFALYGLLRQSRCSGWIPRGRVQKLFSLELARSAASLCRRLQEALEDGVLHVVDHSRHPPRAKTGQARW